MTVAGALWRRIVMMVALLGLIQGVVIALPAAGDAAPRSVTTTAGGGRETSLGVVGPLDLIEGSGEEYYVAPDGVGVSRDRSRPGSKSATLQRVCASDPNRIGGGDTIVFLDGTYIGGRTLTDRNCGDGNYITLRSDNPQGAELYRLGFYFRCSSYFIVEGFDIHGLNTASDPFEVGINILDRNQDGSPCSGGSHHIVVRDNLIRDLSSAGVNAQGSTHIVVEGNTIHDVAHHDPFQTSAISFSGFVDPDGHQPLPGAEGYANIVRDNRVWGVENLAPHPTTGRITDGNCIIMDVLNQFGLYRPRTLIAANVCTDNARGLNILTSSNIDVVDNIFYRNQRHSPAWPEIALLCDSRGEVISNVRLHRNIVAPTPGSPSLEHRLFFGCSASGVSDIEYRANTFADDLSTSALDLGGFPDVGLSTTTRRKGVKACGKNVIDLPISAFDFAGPALDGTADFTQGADSILLGRKCKAR